MKAVLSIIRRSMRRRSTSSRALASPFKSFSIALCLLLIAAPLVSARQRSGAVRLASPEKIVAEYLKALGGKKRAAALRDSVSVWEVSRGESRIGTARISLKNPSALRLDLLLEEGEANEAAKAGAAWARERGATLHTLTDAESHAARLHALLEASRFADFRKQKVLARTVAVEELSGERAYVVEFSTTAGARLRYWFSATNGLVLQMTDEARALRIRYAEWRVRRDGHFAIEPHRLEVTRGGETLTLTLRESRYNVSLADSSFDPPGDDALDIPALLRELSDNQREVDRRINDYTFTRKITEREVNDRGEVKKERVRVEEVYPVVGWGWVTKLISEDGQPLSPERAAKESERAAREMEKAERELAKKEQKRERRRAERNGKDDDDTDDDDDASISAFLSACELVAPRRERFRDRDTIVFDFRPRAGFKPRTRGQSLVSKLSGVIWIDPEDKQVMRLEARLVEGFKMGGGLVASVRTGSAFAFEQTRLPEGVWLPRFSQVNVSAKVFLIAGMSINHTHEYGDYKRFSTKVGEDHLDAPQNQE